jgi:hypothetical protein
VKLRIVRNWASGTSSDKESPAGLIATLLKSPATTREAIAEKEAMTSAAVCLFILIQFFGLAPMIPWALPLVALFSVSDETVRRVCGTRDVYGCGAGYDHITDHFQRD